MLAYLSDNWIDALDQAASSSAALTGIMADRDEAALIIEQIITDPPDQLGAEQVAYHLVLSDGPARVKRGRAEGPAVSFTQSYSTAVAIATGKQNAQAAFMAGNLRVGGRVDLLLSHHGVLVDLEDVFSQLRSRTEW